MPAATLLAHAALLAGLAQAPAYPFAVGETLQYEATLGYFPIGTATAAVARTTRERGSDAFVFTAVGEGGPPGFRAYVTYSTALAPEFVPQGKGWSVVDPESPTVQVGTIPASGVLQVTLPLAHVPFGNTQTFFAQAKLWDPVADDATLAAPALLIRSRPFCR